MRRGPGLVFWFTEVWPDKPREPHRPCSLRRASGRNRTRVTLRTRQVHEPTYATEACGETFFLTTPTGTRTGSAGAPFGVSHLGVLRRAPGSRTPCFLVPNQARSPCRRTRCARVWQSAHSRLTTLRPSSPGLLRCPQRLRPAAAVTVDFRLHLTCSGVVNVVPSPYPLAGTKPGCGESNPDLRFWRPPCFRNTSPERRTRSDPAVPFSALQLTYQDLRDQSNRFPWVPRGLFGPCLAVLLC